MTSNDKPMIFISHAVADSTIADALSDLIKRVYAGAMEPWFSSDKSASGGCRPGGKWFEQIHEKLQNSTRVLTLVTSISNKRPWIYWESGIGTIICKGGMVPICFGININDIQAPLSEFEGVDGLDSAALAVTLQKIAQDAGLDPADDIVKKECVEFVRRIKKSIAESQPTKEEPATKDDVKRLEEKLETLIGKQSAPQPLEDKQKGTQAPNPKVEAAVKEVLKLETSALNISSQLARALVSKLYSSGDIQTALAIQIQVISSKDVIYNDYSNLGVLLSDVGRVDEAEEAYRKAIEIEPKHAGTWYNLGILLNDTNRLAEAEKAFRKAIEIDSKHTEAWSNLGVLLSDTNRLAEAEKAYKKAIDIDPMHANAWSNVGILLGNTGRMDEAEKAFMKAIDIDPKHAISWYNLGVLFKNTGKVNEAEKAFRKAIDIDPKHTNAWCNLGNLLSDTNRLDEAEKAFRKAIDIDPQNVDYQNILAYFLWEQKRYTEAEIVITNALKLDPDNSYANATRGLIYFENDQLDEGKKYYEKAMQIQPQDLPLQQKYHYESGRALSRNGRKEEARMQLKLAKDIDAKYVPLADIEALLKDLDVENKPRDAFQAY